ncbi:MAG TPA: two-component system response regulator CreB [Verrucomicrobia bacterium]|nr:MAG: two-component system response regulator CreB [Lentisphaerae bacterium GWF2_57_35]HBA85789.1 two-component system response regulator CreB [Verrucomicrobiota bacterium]
MQKILVIEDEPSVADNIAYALSTEGFEPLCCSTGREGLKQLQKNPIALLILDVGLPDINGFELCKEIRKTSTTPIVFLTARADEVDRVVGLEIGADDYVVKPFSPRELTARVKVILRRCPESPAAQPQPAQEDRPFEVDAERFCIRYAGQLLNLTRYEFKILEILIHAPGRVYSREKLMDMAWEEPEASMDRTVDAHIKSIRAKLRAIQPKADPIVTHRGLGYSLKENG